MSPKAVNEDVIDLYERVEVGIKVRRPIASEAVGSRVIPFDLILYVAIDLSCARGNAAKA